MVRQVATSVVNAVLMQVSKQTSIENDRKMSYVLMWYILTKLNLKQWLLFWPECNVRWIQCISTRIYSNVVSKSALCSLLPPCITVEFLFAKYMYLKCREESCRFGLQSFLKDPRSLPSVFQQCLILLQKRPQPRSEKCVASKIKSFCFGDART